MRIGFGYDIHKLVSGRTLYIGGVVIPSDKGELGHSDGDVLIHALIDALLGAAALGDIGAYFPPEDPQYKGISSRILLVKTLTLLREKGYTIINIDCTVILEKPKLLPHIGNIRENLAHDLNLPCSSISIKSKTKEGLGFTGQEQAIEAYTIVLIQEQTA
ncbi:MAG: 2-C-methyl-D-erythritol 2,4-cyclodiphosphate synthase [Spirochaetales bacterium]|nr:2-C-methyl-D-erythritol 2,4-cyclodiphosphate synthase [Spirochaetales bacterium]